MKRIRANTLIEILVVMCIISVLAGAMYGGARVFGMNGKSARKDGKGTTTLGLAKLSADDTVCQSNIAQVRLAIQVAQTNGDDKPPATITELKLPKEFESCPLGKEPYVYDPATGKVKCPHPGHEKY